MKKFSSFTNDKKSQTVTSNKVAQVNSKNTIRAVAKQKAGEWMSIINYQYQESDLEQFVF